MTEHFVSYAQHGEDVIIWRALGNGKPGRYVDVGAFDPSEDSVTRALYERGWRGINIEPQASRLAAFERDRPEDLNICAAVGADNRSATLYVPDVNGWATLDDRVAGSIAESGHAVDQTPVEVRTLDSIFAEHGITEVDVLKVDVEGAEAAVFAGLDLGAVRPRVIVVEGVAPKVGRQAGDEAVAMLVAAGYEHCMFDGLNHYLTVDQGLAYDLSRPANPLDDYVPHAIMRYEAAIADLESERAESQRRIVELDRARGDHAAAIVQIALERTELAERIVALEPPAPLSVDEALVAFPAAHFALEDVVRERRAAAFAAMLDHPPDVSMISIELAEPVVDRGRHGLAESFIARSSDAVVRGLYTSILQRDADPAGLRTWSAALDDGVEPLTIARTIAASEEAQGLDPVHLDRIARELAAVVARTALEELARPDASTEMWFVAGKVEYQLLVRAVHRVCFGRPPSDEELTAVTQQLLDGAGREQIISSFARHPATWQRINGSSPAGFGGRVRRRLGRRGLIAVVRSRVAEVELQEVGFLASVAVSVPVGVHDAGSARMGEAARRIR